MSDIILKVENISKQYRLGLIGTGTISHDLNRWWHKIRGKEDPFLKVGSVNDRSASTDSDYVWALKDINFEVKKGEVLGVIGKNGAGKSTLLKILSRVTSPTTGEIKTKGRIASLLEVGTGFHPELTGKENIYLNGAILGMTKKEVNTKIDEIIEFSGCKMYVDTPVKRYSSGMRVRLAFSVAAFLEPDILVIDEVLAVGDAEFQKKAIGKMQDISKGDGRTVLFVSHSMAAVKSLCTRAIVLENGTSVFEGEVERAIDYYLDNNADFLHDYDFSKHKINFKYLKFIGFSINTDSKKNINHFKMGDKVSFEFDLESKIANNVTLRIAIFNKDDLRVMAFDTADLGKVFEFNENTKRTIVCSPEFALPLKIGRYRANISVRKGAILLDHIIFVKEFEILENDIFGFGRFSTADMPLIIMKHTWS